MDITWYGHAAFRLDARSTAGETVRVVLDPYRAPDVGTYAPIEDTADIVAVSHENQKYHSYIAGVSGSPEVVDGLALLDAPQPRAVRGVAFTASLVWENDERREPIAMVGVEAEGVRVLHMGDCGHALSAEEVAACGRVDVLLALAGGAPTLALPDLVRFIGDLRPRVVIPMHFGNDKINLNLRPLDDMLALLPSGCAVRRFDSPTVTVSADTLPPPSPTPEVWVLPPAR
jgi:L-ascorbate metabolism protein UlaG (beta-lactamase superfamily)